MRQELRRVLEIHRARAAPSPKKKLLIELLGRIEKGRPYIIVGLDHPDIPQLHNFYPKKYYESIVHCGYGVFKGETEHGTFDFCGGGAMSHYEFGEDGWVSYSSIGVENAEVLKDLEYDFEKVAKALRGIVNEP